MRKWFTVLCACAGLILLQSVRADVDSAKGYLKEAKDLIAQQDYEGAGKKLDLAESELDGAEASAKATMSDSIAEMRKQITAGGASAHKAEYEGKLRDVMGRSEQAIGDLGAWPAAEDDFHELMKDPDAKAALGPDWDAAQKKFAGFKKLHLKKASVQINGQLEEAIKQLEDQWAKSKPALANAETKSDATDTMQQQLSDTREKMQKLTTDDEHEKAFQARYDKVAAEFTKIALADKVKEVAARIAEERDREKDQWGGYEKETTGPTWDRYSKEVSNETSAFLAPKTRAFIQAMDTVLEYLPNGDDYKAVQSDPSIKALVAGIQSNRKAAHDKMVKFATALVDAAEKATPEDTIAWDRLKSDIRVALGEDAPESVALQARVAKKIADFDAAKNGAEEARTKLSADLTAKANEAWPKLSSGIDAAADPDLSHADRLAGKNIRFTAHNLMGSRFNPDDFYFATTLNGIPVAAKFDPQLMSQIDKTEKALHRTLGDENDGPWEIIATVTDRTAKLRERKNVQAKGTVENMDVKLTGETSEAVDAVVVQVIAAKCGPFAGAKDRGVVKVDGSVGK